MIGDLLPIGSVVLLKGAVKKLMIVGLKPIDEENPDKIYDYAGVIYPVGFLGDTSLLLFDHESINDVIFIGYDNPERQEFLAKLEIALEENNF